MASKSRIIVVFEAQTSSTISTQRSTHSNHIYIYIITQTHVICAYKLYIDIYSIPGSSSRGGTNPGLIYCKISSAVGAKIYSLTCTRIIYKKHLFHHMVYFCRCYVYILGIFPALPKAAETAPAYLLPTEMLTEIQLLPVLRCCCPLVHD